MLVWGRTSHNDKVKTFFSVEIKNKICMGTVYKQNQQNQNICDRLGESNTKMQCRNMYRDVSNS